MLVNKDLLEDMGPHPVQEHLIEDIGQWPIALMSKRRDVFIAQLQEFIYNKINRDKDFSQIKEIVEKTLYLEKSRSKNLQWRVDPPNEILFWNKLQTKITNIEDPSDTVLMRKVYDEVLIIIIQRYAEEIVGTFQSKTFYFARRFLTFFFKLIYNSLGSKGGIFFGNKAELLDKINIYGPINKIRSIGSQYTLVFVPTHSSNLDSIMIGYAIDSKLGLPSFSYGAGLNLYNFGPAAYFMNRLGAYRVDRRKKNQIYLESLIAMSQLSIQDGVNSLFFPGGTRSRSGHVEQKLKLGLLSSAILAQRKLCQRNSENKVIIVPLILSYNFVLEARELIEQYLKSTGQEKYVKPASKTKNFFKTFGYFFRFFSKSSEMSLSLGQPMDVFGNAVDKDGNSIDKFGNNIDIKDYFLTNGELVFDSQRESEYTQLLATKIASRYLEENVILPSQLAAYAAFKLLCFEIKPESVLDIFRLDPQNYPLDFDQFAYIFQFCLDKLKVLESKNQIILSKDFTEGSLNKIMREAIKKLGVYHTKIPLRFKNKSVLISEDFQILYFYHNRLDGYPLVEGLKFNEF
jgi:glycerol-3-phosphate O-acyltransferase